MFHWTVFALWSAFLVFLVLTLTAHKDALANGTDQLAAMRTFYLAESFQDYLDKSLELSVESATRSLADTGGLYQSAGESVDLSFGCGSWRGSPLWNNASKQCFPQSGSTLPEESFKELVANNLNYYLTLYPDVAMYVVPDDLIISTTDVGVTIASSSSLQGVVFDITIPGEEATTGEGTAEDVPAWSIWPVSGSVTDCYGGPRSVPGANPWHQGVDFSASIGTPVHAVADGKVHTICRFGIDGDCRGYGNEMVIRHSDKLYSHYAHLSKFLVAPGDSVRSGDVIALSGNTGFGYCAGVSGVGVCPHLHFSVFTNENRNNQGDYSQNPFRFLPVEYEGRTSPCSLDSYRDPEAP